MSAQMDSGQTGKVADSHGKAITTKPRADPLDPQTPEHCPLISTSVHTVQPPPNTHQIDVRKIFYKKNEELNKAS